MKLYNVKLDTGAILEIEAWSEEEAKREAESECDRDGYPGIAAVQTEEQS